MKHNLEKLKSHLLPLYTQLRDDCQSSESISPFIMQWGNKFPTDENDGIIFYGRATNGWGWGSWDLDLLFSHDDANRGWCRDDQMVWAEKQWHASEDGYVTKNSQFWKIIKGVSTQIYGSEWYDYTAWSNICKAAPRGEGNPSDTLFYNTLSTNIDIFQTEIDFWSPKYIVLLTDGLKQDHKSKIDWTSDYIKRSNNGITPTPIYEIAWDEDNPHINIQVYKIGGKYFIQSLHPQRLKINPHIDTILDIIHKVEKHQI